MTQQTSETRRAPRKAPKQARSLETVKIIVEAAARILEERGHDGFSTNAVADRAGVSIGSLYQYFPSKDALIGALVVRETSLLIEDAHAAAEEATGEAAVGAFIAACIVHQFRRPQLARLLDFEEARLPLDADTRRVGKEIQAITIELLKRPGIPWQQDGDVAARDVVTIIKGLVDNAGLHHETDHAELARRVERAVFGYLGVVPSRRRGSRNDG
jgi:AcrR family transcriptional regulator